jgi:hypothetical protein
MRPNNKNNIEILRQKASEVDRELVEQVDRVLGLFDEKFKEMKRLLGIEPENEMPEDAPLVLRISELKDLLSSAITPEFIFNFVFAGLEDNQDVRGYLKTLIGGDPSKEEITQELCDLRTGWWRDQRIRPTLAITGKTSGTSYVASVKPTDYYARLKGYFEELDQEWEPRAATDNLRKAHKSFVDLILKHALNRAGGTTGFSDIILDIPNDFFTAILLLTELHTLLEGKHKKVEGPPRDQEDDEALYLSERIDTFRVFTGRLKREVFAKCKRAEGTQPIVTDFAGIKHAIEARLGDIQDRRRAREMAEEKTQETGEEIAQSDGEASSMFERLRRCFFLR